MRANELRRAYQELITVAGSGGFGPPPPGEWDALRLLAHIALVDADIASVALSVAAGKHSSYDNRASLDESTLNRIVQRHGDLNGLLDVVRRHGEALCATAEAITDDDLDAQIHILIVSGDQIVVDEPRPVRWLINGVATVHLPRHTEQLRQLSTVVEPA
jgi:hypothetical protein